MTDWLPRRVRGVETEYGLAVSATSQERVRRLGPDEAARLLFKPIIDEHASTNIFLRNGGRLYLDVGSHPEYATGECDRIRDLIVHDRAGDAIMSQLADRAIEVASADGQHYKVQLHKNNLDSHGNSYGSHENYLVSRDTPLRDHAAALTPFLVVRQLLCGAGVWVRGREGSAGQFWISQRAAHMWDPLSSTSTRSRPMINTRDEPHADPQRFRRLHVIVGDSTLSQMTMLLRLGSTELVLRAIEAGERFSDLALADPAAAIRSVSVDRSGRAPLELDSGGHIAAIEVLQRVRDRVAHTADSDELHTVVALWDDVIEAVVDQRFALIERTIDWAIKWRLLQGYQRRHDLAPDDARLAQLDLAFSDIRPGQGLFSSMEAAGQVDTLVSSAEIDQATQQPPQSSRALLRGRLLQAAQQHRRSYTADWMSVSIRDLTDGTVVMADPLVCEDARVDALMARMAAEPRLSSSHTFRV